MFRIAWPGTFAGMIVLKPKQLTDKLLQSKYILLWENGQVGNSHILSKQRAKAAPRSLEAPALKMGGKPRLDLDSPEGNISGVVRLGTISLPE